MGKHLVLTIGSSCVLSVVVFFTDSHLHVDLSKCSCVVAVNYGKFIRTGPIPRLLSLSWASFCTCFWTTLSISYSRGRSSIHRVRSRNFCFSSANRNQPRRSRSVCTFSVYFRVAHLQQPRSRQYVRPGPLANLTRRWFAASQVIYIWALVVCTSVV